MSYEIIKSIVIKNEEVWIKSCSNNVSPRSYETWLCKPLTKILKEQGQKELDKTILSEYWSGNFQAGTQNKYSRSVANFDNDKYNWNSVGFNYELDGSKTPRKYTKEECTNALYDNFINAKKTTRGKFIVGNDNDSYILSTSKGGARVVFNKDLAKVYSFLKAQEISKRFDGFKPINLEQ
jgi:hypothetical protein